jgi:endoglycosylceramidase
LGGIIVPVGFQKGPGGATYDNRQALSYHVYCCGSGPDMCDSGGNPPPSKYHACDKFNPEMVRVRNDDAHRVSRGGALLTEFGACTNTNDCVAEITRTTVAADAKKHGWMYWQYKFFNDVTTQSGDQEGFFNSDGSIQTLKVKALARTYAQTIQGLPLLMSFDTITSKFVLQYTASPAVTQGTVIFTHRDWYVNYTYYHFRSRDFALTIMIG